MLQLLKEDGTLVKGTKSPLGSGELVRLYRAMLRVRLLDERMLTLQRQGRIGFYGACTGQEASVIGSAYALAPQDWILPAFREGGAALLRGLPLESYIAQVYGNTLDITKGRQMPCHYSSREAHYVTLSSCISTQLPQAVGMAWAAKIRNDDAVVLGYLGDGATSASDFHWAMNFAGVFGAPVVFFCQNNQFAISVSVKQQTASESIAIKAIAYGFEGVQVDGNDLLAVYEASRAAVDKARKDGGPTLIEAITYRMGAHSSSDDPSRYRDEKITEHWRTKDPLLRLKLYLQNTGVWDEDRDKRLRAELTEEIQEAILRVERASPPPRQSLFEDVYSAVPRHLQEQMRSLES